jgi:hypothetical protein
VEIFRGNMPLGVIKHSTLASSSISDDGNVWVTLSVDVARIKPGNNVMAVEVHQSGPTSSDLKFDMRLTGIPHDGVSYVNELQYKWVGALQPSSATVVAKLSSASTSCRVVFSTSPSLTSPIYSSIGNCAAAVNYMTKMKVSGLNPATKYYYAVESNGAIDNSSNDIGSFTTPEQGGFSYKFVVASCAVTSDHQVYTAMKNKAPLMYISTGDLHYGNPNSATDINVHRMQYEQRVLMREPARNFFSEVPFAYMWDDHDFSGDGGSAASEGKTNARFAYQEYIPHYNLPSGYGDVPIYQAFTIGRVRFIMSDLRSEKTATSLMSAKQKSWFKSECIRAKKRNEIIAWVTGVSFGGHSADNWGGYPDERRELSDFFRDNEIRNMFILSGDAHMIAIDNGSNHDFSTGKNNPYDYPVFQAAALNNKGSYKGGTYSEGGTFPNPDASIGQYGLVEVLDDGGSSITIKFTAYRTVGNSIEENILTSYTFSRILATRSPTTLSARAVEDGIRVQLAWNLEDTARTYTLKRSYDKEAFFPVLTTGRDGSFIDSEVRTGWNYYILEAPGHAPVEQRIFIKGKASMQLAPNPASSQVKVYLLNIRSLTSGRYILYNSSMKTELQGDIPLQEGENTFVLDVSQISSGEYILHVVLGGREISGKLIITK